MIELVAVSVLNFIIFIVYMKFDQIKFNEKLENMKNEIIRVDKKNEKLDNELSGIEHQLHLQEEMITRLETKIDLLLQNKINLN